MCVAVIVAPGRAAPLSSSTAPRSSAWATCAEAADGTRLKERTRSGNTGRRDMQLLLEGRGRVAVAVTASVSTARRTLTDARVAVNFKRASTASTAPAIARA